MKTKYVLHGGFTPGIKSVSDSFFRKVLKDTPNELKILIVYFATDNGDKYFPEDQVQFEQNGQGKKLTFKKATIDNFKEETEQADIIYLHGGNSLKMLETMKGFPELKDLLKGKIVAADSAGANILSVNFYSKRNGICKGFGILPIKFIPHFEEENKSKLDHVNPNLETICLREYEHKLIETT